MLENRCRKFKEVDKNESVLSPGNQCHEIYVHIVKFDLHGFKKLLF